MLNAQYDLLVPRRFTEELWRAMGAPPIRWLPAGHITAFLFRRAIAREILAAIGLSPPAAAPGRTERGAPSSSLSRAVPQAARPRRSPQPG
jgi:hypothetical protein